MGTAGAKTDDHNCSGRQPMNEMHRREDRRREKNRGPGPVYFRKVFLLACLAVISIWAIGAAADGDAGYLAVTGPCRMQFPADHGAHPGFRTEWWYYAGNLQARERRFGFQLTIFRRRIGPPAAMRSWPDPASRWRTQQIYLGHAAVTDIADGRHVHSESIARGALGLAGVRQSDDRTTVLLNDWSIDIRPDSHRLQAAAADFSLDLRLQPMKPPVLHGDRGYSRKGDSPERASCYYSITRLQTAGTLRLGEKVFTLSGSSWMDHEYSTASLQPGLSGWDWFSLQLDNGAELMIYLLRREDGTFHPASSGTLVDAGGRWIHLSASDFQVKERNYWKSPHSAARYPSGWTVRIDAYAIDITVNPAVKDQELRTGGTTGVTYWEGSVFASGSAAGRPVKGSGYVELTGYAGGMEALQ